MADWDEDPVVAEQEQLKRETDAYVASAKRRIAKGYDPRKGWNKGPLSEFVERDWDELNHG